MSTQIDPRHNLDATDILTAEFLFADGAKIGDTIKAFKTMGNIVSVTPAVDVTRESHVGSYRSGRRKDKTVVIESNLGFKVKADELSLTVLGIALSGDEGDAFTQNVVTAAALDSIAFTSPAPGKVGYTYDLLLSGAKIIKFTEVFISKGPAISVTADGTTNKIAETSHGRANDSKVMFVEGTMPTGLTKGVVYYVRAAASGDYELSLTAGGSSIDFTGNGSGLKVATTVMEEGTDYELDLTLGMFTILGTALTTTIYPYGSAPAITSSSEDYYRSIIPLTNLSRSGVGRINFYDQDADNPAALKFHDFECDVSVDPFDEIDGKTFSAVTLQVDVAADTGATYIRRKNTV